MIATTPMSRARRARGFSLVELMISVAISLLILAGLTAMLVNVSGSNSEMAKSNAQIENGRFAVQVLEGDLVHAGFWGTFVPQFDDLNFPFVPQDTPAAIPDPCLAFTAANWDFAHKNNLVGIPVEAGPAAPGGCTLSDKAANTDYLVVRHAANCVPGVGNCAAQVNGQMHFQSSLCSNATYGQAQSGTPTTLRLAAPSATNNTLSTDDAYRYMTIRTVGGTGAGQTRSITGYVGGTNTVTVSPAWTTTPDATTTYTIVESVLDTGNYDLRKRGSSCATATVADVRKFISNIYYIRSYASTAGDGIPTLVRSSFDPGTLTNTAQAPAEALVEGVERMAVEIGIDNLNTRCALGTAPNYNAAVVKISPTACAVNTVDPSANTLPNNRGDGAPDTFIRCTAATPCTVADLRNAVAVKLYLLVRNTEATVGYTDSKTYCMGALPVGGTCPAANVAGPFSDGFKRHLFSTTVRLTSVSGRRETP